MNQPQLVGKKGQHFDLQRVATKGNKVPLFWRRCGAQILLLVEKSVCATRSLGRKGAGTRKN